MESCDDLAALRGDVITTTETTRNGRLVVDARHSR